MIPFARRVAYSARSPCVAAHRRASTVSNGYASVVKKSPDDVVITFAKRTATGKFQTGQLNDVPPDELLHAVFKATLAETKLDPKKIDDICVGVCYPPSPVYASRTAAITAGIPVETTLSSVNRLCSSGLMAIRHIANAIKSGEISVGMAVGVEVMSQHGKPTPILTDIVASDPRSADCREHMGWTSEMLAKEFGISRKRQDEYAYIGHTRANKAHAAGRFKLEILPIELRGKVINTDDTIRPDVTLDSLSKLPSAFPQWGDGLTTAGNAGPPGDGAALCILASRQRAEAEGWPILAKYVATTTAGLEPRFMGNGPIPAIKKILSQLGLTKEEIDIFEINEAFASQLAYCIEQLGLPMAKVNPNGGAFALTHPVGMTGMRQVVTGLTELQQNHGSILCTSMCVGAGMGAAGVFVNEVGVGMGESG